MLVKIATATYGLLPTKCFCIKEVRMEIIDTVKKISQVTSNRVHRLQDAGSLSITPSTPHLLFPLCRSWDAKGPSVRVSEQEARFTFTRVIEDQGGLFYSVEVPTAIKHCFTGSKARSASFDLVLYSWSQNTNKVCQSCLIEFKHDATGIYKDICKLIREPGEACAAWYQLIGNSHSGTLVTLFRSLKSAFIDDYLKTNNVPTRKIIFHICVLNPSYTLQKVFSYNPTVPFKDFVDDFFDIDYKVSRSKFNFTNINGWDDL